MADTEFDIIVYGATGYTGRLVAEHFVREYGNAADAPKWAMAGRDPGKLERVRDEIGAPSSPSFSSPNSTRVAPDASKHRSYQYR